MTRTAKKADTTWFWSDINSAVECREIENNQWVRVADGVVIGSTWSLERDGWKMKSREWVEWWHYPDTIVYSAKESASEMTGKP